MNKARQSAAGGSPGASRPLRPGVVYALFGALCLTNAVTLVALLMAPDIARLVERGSAQTLGAYEERIAQLRVEVDRLYSREYAQAGNANLQMHELVQQQEVLLEQQYFVRALAQRAAELGLATAALGDADEPAPLLTGAAAPTDVETIGRDIDRMMAESRIALAAISGAASSSTAAILGELRAVGISPELPAPAAPAGIGGPFQPAIGSMGIGSGGGSAAAAATTLIDDANAVIGELTRFRAAREALGEAPIHRPLLGEARLSSNFGNRRDPFNGRAAFHAGVDYAAPPGTPVLSAGAGRVVFAGVNGGYGNMVEIDHGDGLSTRYAHLSAILVGDGEVLAAGSQIGRVGSTGRSTGPHLHFEVRRNDRALDPTPFLGAGTRLAQYLR